jgi:hypothetical protein
MKGRTYTEVHPASSRNALQGQTVTCRRVATKVFSESVKKELAPFRNVVRAPEVGRIEIFAQLVYGIFNIGLRSPYRRKSELFYVFIVRD